MPKSAQRRLKVFQAQLGFYDTVVAAPSQAAALRAWGVHQNLFANGEARITKDEDAVRAALAHPETPLKRALGSNDPFGLEANLPEAPAAKRRTPAARPSAKARPQPEPPPPADRSALDAAEAALLKLDQDRKHEEAALRRQQDALDERRAAAQADYVTGRKAATAAVLDARKAYRKAGGIG